MSSLIAEEPLCATLATCRLRVALRPSARTLARSASKRGTSDEDETRWCVRVCRVLYTAALPPPMPAALRVAAPRQLVGSSLAVWVHAVDAAPERKCIERMIVEGAVVWGRRVARA